MTGPMSAPIWQWLLVAGVAAAVARPFTAVIGRLAGPPALPVSRRRGIEIGYAAAVVAVWWWEVLRLGEMPVHIGFEPGMARAVWVRYLAHVVLFTLLAAATWIDFRHRVIPDCITVPGVIIGLVATTLAPQVLLPVACETPREYASPLLTADVLGAFGPLRGASTPRWLAPWPAVTGLGAACFMYAAWWWGCTAPAEPPAAAARGRMPRVDPRLLVLGGGLAGVGAAWWHGGDHWPALLSSLIGMIVAALLVWLTREGASRALGQEAMGLGDVTLMAMVGAWLGWQAAVLTCCLAVFIGLGHGLMQFVLHRENELPFGPSLCLGGMLTVVGWQPIWQRTASTFASPLELGLVVAAVVLMTAVALAWWRRFRGRSQREAA